METELLKPILEKYLTQKWNQKLEIKSIHHLSGGACQDNYYLLVEFSEGKSEFPNEMVLRTDKGASLLSSLSKKEEFLVAKILYESGVKTPRPILLEEDSSILGSPFFLMEKIQGKATGRYITKDSELNSYRKVGMAQDLASNLAKIHNITPDQFKDSSIKQILKPMDKEEYIPYCISDLRISLDALPEAHPAIEIVLNWLEANSPDSDSLVLVHGDYRTGNFMMNPSGLQGILDFEFAHWGDRYEDIAWLCMKDWRFGKINKEVGGFADRKDFYKYYEEESQYQIDPNKVKYWEILGNIRWAIGSAQQAERHLSGKDKGIELAAIGRRTGEMEWEAMKLVEDLQNAIQTRC